MAAGAYGLTVEGLAGAGSLLVADPPGDWPTWRLSACRGDGAGDAHVGADSATVPLHPAGRLDLQRDSRRATLTMPEPPGDEALAHPYLAAVAAIAALWHGRLAFHGGAFGHRGRAWAVLGDKGDGKSSMLAALAAAGVPVLADDLVVVDGGDVLAGPRCIDLREDAAAALGAGRPIGSAGGRERYRVALGPVPAAVPLGGWLTLGWADAVAVATPPAHERLPTLLDAMALQTMPSDPARYLDLAARPLLALRRPRDHGALAATVAAAIGAVDRAA